MQLGVTTVLYASKYGTAVVCCLCGPKFACSSHGVTTYGYVLYPNATQPGVMLMHCRQNAILRLHALRTLEERLVNHRWTRLSEYNMLLMVAFLILLSCLHACLMSDKGSPAA